MSTYTITFGDCAENSIGMEILGSKRTGITEEEMIAMAKTYEGAMLYDLTGGDQSLPAASILILPEFLKYFSDQYAEQDFVEEQQRLVYDVRCWMKGRVVNKRMRSNICFADFAQEPDYEAGKGRIVDFQTVPCLAALRAALPEVLHQKKLGNLLAEGNHYFDEKKCGIGFHGDAERTIVIAARLGSSMPLFYQWYQRSQAIGAPWEFTLHGGDVYIMSEKAVGTDWRRKIIPTLRHAAGECQRKNLVFPSV